MVTQEQTIAEVISLPPLPLWPEGGQPDGITDGPVPCLTPYLPVGVTPQGAIIVCPGGGYGNGAAHEREPIARWLAGLGLAAFVVDYRVAPPHHPVAPHAGHGALRAVRPPAGG